MNWSIACALVLLSLCVLVLTILNRRQARRREVVDAEDVWVDGMLRIGTPDLYFMAERLGYEPHAMTLEQVNHVLDMVVSGACYREQQRKRKGRKARYEEADLN
jgi:hypothetical protein